LASQKRKTLRVALKTQMRQPPNDGGRAGKSEVKLTNKVTVVRIAGEKERAAKTAEDSAAASAIKALPWDWVRE
jgi:hypothetical protein